MLPGSTTTAPLVSVTSDQRSAIFSIVRVRSEENGTAPYAVVANSGVMPGYWVLNGRLSLAEVALGPDNSRLEISAWGKNIANKSYRTDEYNAPGTAPGTTIQAAAFGNPRTYGLTVNYKFN